MFDENADRHQEANGFARFSTIIQRTRTLHLSVGYVIDMSERLGIHASSLHQIQKHVDRIHQDGMTVLKERLEDTSLMLGHYSRTCQIMKEQMQNLLNLVT